MEPWRISALPWLLVEAAELSGISIIYYLTDKRVFRQYGGVGHKPPFPFARVALSVKVIVALVGVSVKGVFVLGPSSLPLAPGAQHRRHLPLPVP